MLDKNDMTEIKKAFDVQVHDECEQAWELWCKALLSVPSPEPLDELLRLFCSEKKHYFFRNYKQQVISKIKLRLKTPNAFILKRDQLPALEKACNIALNFSEQKDRLFLETYLQCGENGRETASRLGVAKSTFHDWLSQHRELVEIEKNKNMVSN